MNLLFCSSGKEVKNTLVLVGAVSGAVPYDEKPQIGQISQFNDFEFEDGGIRIRKQSGIGKGKFIPMEERTQPAVFKCEIWKSNDRKIPFDASTSREDCLPSRYEPSRDKSSQSTHIESEQASRSVETESEEFGSTTAKRILHPCPKSKLCTKKFMRKSDALMHNTPMSRCTIPKKTMPTNEFVKREHFKQFGLQTDGSTSNLRYFQTNICPLKEHLLPESVTKIPCTIRENCNMGSALLGKRKRAINYPDVTKYLKQKFDAGKGGAKFKPTTVERMMRQEFPVEKLKSATEIKNIFSRFTLQEKGNKDPTEEEIEEASAELDAIYESDVIAEIDKKLESSKDGIYLSGHTLQV